MNKKYREDFFNEKRRNPLTEQEMYAFPRSAEPMFDSIKLRKAYDYWSHHVNDNSVYSFMNYLLRLEKDVPLDNQRIQP